eukprot:2591957-Amphidinium_carterae.1
MGECELLKAWKTFRIRGRVLTRGWQCESLMQSTNAAAALFNCVHRVEVLQRKHFRPPIPFKAKRNPKLGPKVPRASLYTN